MLNYSKNGIIDFKVKENPIIQSIINKWNKNKNIYDNLSRYYIKIEKYPFVENKINDQLI